MVAMGVRVRSYSLVGVVASAILAVASVLVVGCSSATQPGTLSVQTIFRGNVPGDGQPFVIGLLGTDGRLRAKKDVLANHDVRFRIAAGTYEVAAWLQGTSFTRRAAVCYNHDSPEVKVGSGSSVLVKLSCTWN